jgi:hypothetical protein
MMGQADSAQRISKLSRTVVVRLGGDTGAVGGDVPLVIHWTRCSLRLPSRIWRNPADDGAAGKRAVEDNRRNAIACDAQRTVLRSGRSCAVRPRPARFVVSLSGSVELSTVLANTSNSDITLNTFLAVFPGLADDVVEDGDGQEEPVVYATAGTELM